MLTLQYIKTTCSHTYNYHNCYFPLVITLNKQQFQMKACGLTPAPEDESKKQNLLQGQGGDLQFIPSRLHYCGSPSGGLHFTARHQAVSRPASSHSSLRWATKNKPLSRVSFTKRLQRIPGEIFRGNRYNKMQLRLKRKRKRKATRPGSFPRLASLLSPRRTRD